jgi:hypothetical protein
MAAIHEEAEDDTRSLVDLWALRESLGLSDEQMAKAVDYLENEGLIHTLRTLTGQFTPMSGGITHSGIIEMERSASHPNEPTEYFPPLKSVVVNIGSVHGSPFQIGSPGATLHADVRMGSVEADEMDQVREFLKEYARRLPELQQELPASELAELVPRVGTVQNQIDAPQPEGHVLKDTLASIKAILEHAAGGVAATALLTLLPMLH